MRQQANDMAHLEGMSLNHFISVAVAEKISRLEQAAISNEQLRAKYERPLQVRSESDRRGAAVRS
jgi:hypothetical protein